MGRRKIRGKSIKNLPLAVPALQESGALQILYPQAVAESNDQEAKEPTSAPQGELDKGI